MPLQSDVVGSTSQRARWLHLAAAHSEAARLVADFDWERSPLGPIDQWPTELWSAVQLCLSSRFPIMLAWGPEQIQIYNDGFAQIVGRDKHPGALGTSAPEIWGEVWETVGPLFESVMVDGETVWIEDQLLAFERAGFAEECHFTYSYSPLFDGEGRVAGLLDIVTETTAAVINQRRQRCIMELSKELLDAETTLDVFRVATAVLTRCPQLVTAVDLYLCVDEELVLAASNRRGRLPSIEGYGDLDVVTILDGPTNGDPVREVSVPMGRAQEGPMGAAVLSLNQRRPFDDGYRDFVALLGRTIGSALEQADRHISEVDEYRQIGDALQQAMLQPASDLPTVAARYRPAAGNLAVGGDWYDVIDLEDGRRALVVGDCVGHGLDAAAAMSQLRSASRAMLVQGLDPAATLDALGQFAASVPGADCATAVCVVIDRAAGTLTYSSAGHLPPLIVGAEGATWLDGATSPPLAVSTLAARNARRSLHVGDVLILYTDGLIERPDEAIDDSLAGLAAAAVERSGASVHDIAEHLMDSLVPPDRLDDVVVVVKRLEDLEGGSAMERVST